MLKSDSLLLHLQIRAHLMDGSSSTWVCLTRESTSYFGHAINNHLGARKSSFAPSSNPSSPATSLRVVLPLRTFAPKPTKRQNPSKLWEVEDGLAKRTPDILLWAHGLFNMKQSVGFDDGEALKL